ncbi:MAG TPA: hypothetical protein VFS20_27730 [Longimicrobium sp.]|nr:hypothetical protein [Longimicrobium sp.]
MLPPDVEEWLRANDSGPVAWPGDHRNAIRRELDALRVDPSSELGYFYLNFHPSTVTGWYELHEVDVIREWTAFAHTELEVPEEFLALTSTEGDGIVLYSRNTGQVFDVQYGQFEALAAGTLQPVGESFSEYLRWCRAQSERDDS